MSAFRIADGGTARARGSPGRPAAALASGSLPTTSGAPRSESRTWPGRPRYGYGAPGTAGQLARSCARRGGAHRRRSGTCDRARRRPRHRAAGQVIATERARPINGRWAAQFRDHRSIAAFSDPGGWHLCIRHRQSDQHWTTSVAALGGWAPFPIFYFADLRQCRALEPIDTGVILSTFLACSGSI